MCVVQRVHLRVVLVGSYILHPGVHVVFLFLGGVALRIVTCPPPLSGQAFGLS